MSMDHILPEKEHSPVTMYNVLLYNQWQCQNTQRDDELFVVYRDEKGHKKVHSIKNPPMEIYFVKPEHRGEFLTPREYLEIDKTYSAKVPARMVLNRIYDELKNAVDPVGTQLRRVYQNAIETGQYRSKKEILKWPYTLMSDMSVEDYYWVHLGYHYDLMHGHVIDKCFADIENDIYGLSSSEQAANMDPVNACTCIFSFDDKGPYAGQPTKVFTFLLRDHKRYPQQKDFEDKLGKFYQTCHEKFDQQTIIKNGKKKLIEVKADYQIVMCNTEQELLQGIFDSINKYKPDLCEFWNMPYDMPKMKARMEILGMDPVSVMSDKDFFPRNTQFAKFHIDRRPIDIAERNSYIRMTSTTQYIDQMQNYAGIRKGRKAYGSNKLDNIANIELGMGKWSFPKGIDVRNAAIKDYWDFVLYNIRDVWCQYLIDLVTNDTMSIVYDMNQQNCPMYSLIKQTKYQKQIYYAWYLRKGFVPGNNINTNYTRFESEEDQERLEEIKKRQRLREMLDKAGLDADDIEEALSDPEYLNSLDIDIDDDEESEEKEQKDGLDAIAEEEIAKAMDNVANFEDSTDRKLPLPGGLVGNPDFNSANGTELIDGVPSKHVFDEVMDEDYASEYPWAKFTRSLSRSTQAGRLIIPKKVSEYQNVLPLGQQKRKSDNKMYIPGAEFTSDYISQDYLMFGSVWFNLPFVDEMEKLVDEALEGDDY